MLGVETIGHMRKYIPGTPTLKPDTLEDIVAWNSALAACSRCFEWKPALQVIESLHGTLVLPKLAGMYRA